jgi:hypothetical protein
MRGTVTRRLALALALSPYFLFGSSFHSDGLGKGACISYQICDLDIRPTLTTLSSTFHPVRLFTRHSSLLSLETLSVTAISAMAMNKIPGRNIYIGGWVPLILTSYFSPSYYFQSGEQGDDVVYKLYTNRVLGVAYSRSKTKQP